MQTRRDQLQAYRFQNRRALAALVTGEPNVLEPPMRRLTVTTLSGIMIAILVAAGVALFAVFKPEASSAWKNPGVIIDVNGTGARYVRAADGTLHPVANYTSAALYVGGVTNGAAPTLVHVDSGDLGGATFGKPIGIPDLPDALPPATGLTAFPLTVCSRQQESSASGEFLEAQVSVYLGSTPRATDLPPDGAVVVRPADQPTAPEYLVANGHRFALPTVAATSTAVKNALGIASNPTLQVGSAYLNSLPQGPGLAPLAIPGSGTPSTVRIDGKALTIGQLVEEKAATGALTPYVVLQDGLKQVNQVQAGLALALGLPGDDETIPQASAIGVSTNPASWKPIGDRLTGLPQTISQNGANAASTNGGLCTVYRNDTATPTLAVPPSQLPSTQGLTVVHQSATSQQGVADTVTLAGGDGAAVVRADTNATTTPYLIASPGDKYLVYSTSGSGGSNGDGGSAVLKALGYGDVKPTPVPGQLLQLFPTGPALNPAAARRPTG